MNFFLDHRFFLLLGAVIVALVVGEFIAVFAGIGRAGLLVVGGLVLVDVVLLWGGRSRGVIEGERRMAERLSNGDLNDIRLHLRNRYPFPVRAIVVDEVPVQFQVRDASYHVTIPSGGGRTLLYRLRPVRRGIYEFGRINLFARTPLGIVQRRFRIEASASVPVYPSWIQMRRFRLMAEANRLAEIGIRRVRRVGRTLEFDQIREYVQGDDYRTINWKATARRPGALMVNQYQDERSQQVYSLIDKGRGMRMPFEEMTLLDYAINASLVLSNIALMKQDRAGLVTFADRVEEIVIADRRPVQMQKISETLYHQETGFPESDYEALSVVARRQIHGRSLLLLFTNIETLSALERRLPSLRALSREHLLVVVLFENTELRERLEARPTTTEEIAVKAVAERFVWEKRRIAGELAAHGILSIHTSPENLTAATINKYLEIKARRLV